MAQIQPEQAAFIRDAVYLPTLKNEFGVTKRVIAAILPGKESFTPDQYSRPALDLAWHIVATEVRFLSAIPAGEFDLTPSPMPESIKTSADLVAWYEDQFNQLVAKLEAASPEAMAKVIDFRGVFQLPAVSYMGFVAQHTAHHRGQLSVYLRPMGSKVPAIYGESYDSAEAKKAAK